MNESAEVYEKLGVFYLGREFDTDERTTRPDYLLYDSKDLVTHAVIVGMTGSGKTGLGIGLLEEAAIDQVPALVVDPKGDLTNLLLNFPELRPEDFRPWVNADDAQRAGQTVDAYAAAQAKLWQDGLRQWDQSGARIGRLREAADFAIYTPGSDAGVPISILASFAAPPANVMEDADLVRDRISSTATGVLALLGIDADPIRSREHILLTNILNHAWNQGRDLDLGSLIHAVQSPPMQKVGVMDLEAFFPEKERFELAMTLNNLLASPSFAAWLQGEALDVDRLLYTSSGKPRLAVFSIAHLSESERMFFLTMLLNQTLTWMRTQAGTSSLRALLYIDEIFGYMPPVAEPPTKKPLLTLLKQARAYGLGLVLATQNPVDLDYKGLSNTGTWFLGRLQTERDKQRVLDGLLSVSSTSGNRLDRSEIDTLLSGLGKRVFLMHNVHEQRPVTFQTRWALSYLSGPMTRLQIKQLMEWRRGEGGAADARESVQAKDSAPGKDVLSAGSGDVREPADDASDPTRRPAVNEQDESQPLVPPSRPVLSSRIDQVVLPPNRPITASRLVYMPKLLGTAKVHYVRRGESRTADEELALLANIATGPLGIDWETAEALTPHALVLEHDLLPAQRIETLPEIAQESTNYTRWKKALENYLYRRCYPLHHCPLLDQTSRPGESERDFRIRLSQAARERRDKEVDALRDKYAKQIDVAEERLRKAEQKLARERSQAEGARMDSVISIGATVLGALLGRKRMGRATLGRATTAARGAGRASRQQQDVRRASDDVFAYEEQLGELEREMEQELQLLALRYDPATLELTRVELKPRRSDIDIRTFALAWAPFELRETGESLPLYDAQDG